MASVVSDQGVRLDIGRRNMVRSSIPPLDTFGDLPLEKEICMTFLVLSETDVKFGGPSAEVKLACIAVLRLALRLR